MLIHLSSIFLFFFFIIFCFFFFFFFSSSSSSSSLFSPFSSSILPPLLPERCSWDSKPHYYTTFIIHYHYLLLFITIYRYLFFPLHYFYGIRNTVFHFYLFVHLLFVLISSTMFSREQLLMISVKLSFFPSYLSSFPLLSLLLSFCFILSPAFCSLQSSFPSPSHPLLRSLRLFIRYF